MSTRWAPIAEVLTARREQLDVTADQTYKTLGLLNRGRGVFVRPPISGRETKYKHFFAVHSRDLVYSKLFAWEGSVAVVPAGFEGFCVSPEFPVFAIDENQALPEYLAHVVQSEAFTQALSRATTGMGQRRQRVNVEDFALIDIPLPDLLRQRRIVEYLQRLESAVQAERRATTNARIEHEALLSQVVERAAGTTTRSIAELVERDRDWIELEEGRQYAPIGIRGFNRGLIRYPELDRSELSKLRYYRLKPERLVISNIKAWEGAVTRTFPGDEGRIASNRFLQYAVIDSDVSLAWLHRYLVSPQGIAQLQAASPGSADRNRTLSMENFEALRVPVPPLPVQQKVADFADRVDVLNALIGKRSNVSEALMPAARNEVFQKLEAR